MKIHTLYTRVLLLILLNIVGLGGFAFTQNEAQASTDFLELQDKLNPGKVKTIRMGERVKLSRTDAGGGLVIKGKVSAIEDSALTLNIPRLGPFRIDLGKTTYVAEESKVQKIIGAGILYLAAGFVLLSLFLAFGVGGWAAIAGILLFFFAGFVALIGLLIYKTRWRKRWLSRYNFVRKVRTIRLNR